MTRKLTTEDAIRISTLRKNDFDLHDGWTVVLKAGKVKRLANFLAWPSKRILLDDGATVSRFYDINGILEDGKILPTARLTPEEFFGNFPIALSKYWGMDIIIKPRAKDDLREAMQILGQNCREETIYTYTGWRQINNKWIFLHAGGAIGADNVSVDLSEGGAVLARYALPDRCDNAKEVANVAFSMLNLAEPEIVYPLFAAVFLAPLCEVLQPHSLQADFMLFVIGRTQSGKSSLAALFLSFFGNFDKNNFPANYRQTANSLERTSFLLKDVMMVVDDFFPGQSHQEREKMKEIAQRLARAYGDGAVRQRMQGRKLQESWAPRGLAISTGEERPEIGESGQARFVFIDVNRDAVNYDALLSLQQEHKSKLAEFMMLYLEWVAANWNRIYVIFMDIYQRAQKAFINDQYSGRINESVAKLCGGMEVVLTFAKEQGYITQDDYDRHGELAYQAFTKVFNNNISSLVSEKPSQKFLAALSEIMQQSPERFCINTATEAPQNPLGCYDADYLYLFPTTCFKAIQAHCSATGVAFPIGDKMLWKHLRAEGIIEGNDTRSRNTVQVRLACFGGKNVDVLKIKINWFDMTE